MSKADEWSRGYAIQAKADLAARQVLLQAKGIPDCQQLHFLQMACEKICKAHLYNQGTITTAFQASHAYVAKVLPVIAKQHFAADRKYGWALTQIRQLAREIALIAPVFGEAPAAWDPG
jgi:hypothetical protein